VGFIEKTSTVVDMNFLNTQIQCCREKEGNSKEYFWIIGRVIGLDTNLLETLSNKVVVDAKNNIPPKVNPSKKGVKYVKTRNNNVKLVLREDIEMNKVVELKIQALIGNLFGMKYLKRA